MPQANPPYLPLHGPVCHEVLSVVLDTNVVLDWLVFNDVSCKVLAGQLDARRLRWHATDAMRAELCSVLPRPALLAWTPDDEHVLSVFDRLAGLRPVAPTQPLSSRLRCRDSDDQKFIDLAIASGVRWLFSRDRALLDLAKPALEHGVEILTPADWWRRYPAPAPHDERIGAA
jgi:putative PIN family toxin of toxin-antitoxin system